MTLFKPFNPDLPKAYGDCRCNCHTMPGVHHIMPCCYPGADEKSISITGTKEGCRNIEKALGLAEGTVVGWTIDINTELERK